MNLFSFIKQHIALLDVISEYATLKKAGMYFKGTCPFHYERTASFTVSPHKDIFYCFGCHAGGDVISFIAKIEHCSPLEAAKQLIERYNLTLPKEITLEKSSHTQEGEQPTIRQRRSSRNGATCSSRAILRLFPTSPERD